jgi:hypothetical protein
MLHPWRKLLRQDNLAYVVYASKHNFSNTALVAIKIITSQMSRTCFLTFIDTFRAFKNAKNWLFFLFFFCSV